MTRRSTRPHPFLGDPEAPDWRKEFSSCARCGLGKANAIHRYDPAEGDRSDAILGEHDDRDAA